MVRHLWLGDCKIIMAQITFMNPGYHADMQIVDNRLTKLEKAYEEISQLLTGLSMDIKLIAAGGKSGIKKEEEQNAVKDS